MYIWTYCMCYSSFTVNIPIDFVTDQLLHKASVDILLLTSYILDVELQADHIHVKGMFKKKSFQNTMCLKILFSWIHFTCRSIYTYIYFFFLQEFERKMINDKTSQFLSQVICNEHVQSLLLFSLMTKVKTEVLDRVVLTTDDPQDSPHPLQKHGEGDE